MTNTNRGAGVRRFLEAHASGEEIDVTAIVKEHPGEALALADAFREVAIQKESAAKERMWLARAEVLSQAGEDISLGGLIRTSREYAGLSTSDLSARMRERGVSVQPTAIDLFEAGRVTITNVTISGLWPALAEILDVDRHRLVATIRGTLANPQSTQSFTRMSRGATSADREGLLSSGVSPQQEDSAASYINWVREELGLPLSPADTVQ